MNKDLQRERSLCTFNPIELTHFLDGSPENTEQRHERGIQLFKFFYTSLQTDLFCVQVILSVNVVFERLIYLFWVIIKRGLGIFNYSLENHLYNFVIFLTWKVF